MIRKKHIAVLFVFMLAFATYFLTTCKSKAKLVHNSHYIDTNDTRLAQIEKCASCHKEVYENWKMGPHANAYLTLDAFDLMLDSSTSFPAGYNEYVEANNEKICMTCHTGQNIFETNFVGVSHKMSPHLVNKDSFPNFYLQAFGRDINNKKELLTGVDCLTCHVQGDQVVTNIKSTASESTGLVKSNLFSANRSCFSCHHHQVSTMEELVAENRISNEVGCVNCHQEYDAQKRGTHYFYWRNDHASKKRPAHLNIFECVKVNISNDGDNGILHFNWTNSVMPHGFSECGEAKCVVVGVGGNKGKKIFLEQYINRKDFFDAVDIEMPNHFSIGKNGNQFEYNKPILMDYNIENLKQFDSLIIYGYVRPQYWSDEKEFVQVYRRAVPLSGKK